MSFLKQHSKGLFLLSVLAAGILLAPFINNQGPLSQGDHGRDLYAAQAVYRGELPYRDFWWVYGPLMPYYYGLFFKIFGNQITSILIGKLILKISGGILICLGLMEITSELTAFIGACWFLLFQQDFFFTYNHLGGLVMILGTAYCLLTYIKKNSPQAAFGALAFVFTLCLIKINFGLAALAVSVITIGITDLVRRTSVSTYKKLFFALAFTGLPLLVFIIYWFILKGLSIPEIRQCLPYMEGDQPYSMAPLQAIMIFLQNTFHTAASNRENLCFALLINTCTLRCLYLILKKKIDAPRQTALLLSFGMLSLFYLANCHEYLKSGVWYRVFWSQPLSMMIIFILIDTATQSIHRFARIAVFLFLAVLVVSCGFTAVSRANAAKTPSRYLSVPRGDVYVDNSPSWITTVEETAAFLNKTLKPDELFFALPYDCLYYYLTGKRTPTRQLIFFEHIKIPPEQEKSVIAQLQRNHVNYILISNRAFARQEHGLGIFGRTYCPLIAAYIQDHFVPIAKFGNWTDEPGWAWAHGTMILKRKGVL